MPNPYFRFKQFTVYHDRCAMKVTTDSCAFGAWAAEEIQESKSKIERILDIGAGSGLLSLMIAQKNDAVIDAVEIDEEAAIQAKENIAASPWQKKIQVHSTNILDFQPAEKYDAIICNPPFYESELASNQQQKNIAHHSEALSLAQVLAAVKQHLHVGGIFFVLSPFKRSEEIKQLVQQNGLYLLESVILKQSLKHQPFRMMIMGTNKKSSVTNTHTISVWDQHQQYTENFIRLLKDYYLYL